MKLVFDDKSNDSELEIVIFGNFVRLNIINDGVFATIELENEDFFKICKLYSLYYDETPGFEHLEY
jgi:hypothetical protein